MLNPTFLESCFGANYIGIRGYCNDDSTSGYFLNDEVNITQDQIARLASSDDVKTSAFVDRLIRNAIRDTCKDFLRYLNKYGKYITKNITASRELTNALTQKRNIKDVGEYMSIRIDYVKVSEDTTMHIDADGVRQSVELTSGVNSLNKIIIAEAISLHFDVTNAIIVMEDIPEKTYFFTSEVTENDVPVAESGEVKFRISSLCSFEKLICDNKQLLSEAIFYHCVGLFFKEKMTSTYIDNFIANSKEESEDLYKEYLYGFEDKKSKYHDALIFAVNNLKQVLNKNYCFTCTGMQVQSLI